MEPNQDTFVYLDLDHNNFLLEKLNTLRKNKQFCDVILQVGTPQDIHEIYAHRAVLASASRYFLEIFTNDSSVKPSGIPQLQLYKLLSNNYDLDAFNYLFEFIYTSRLEIPRKSVRNVYALAIRLRMTTIAQKCGEFLASTLTPDTCLLVRSTNGVLNDPILLNSVDNYIKEHISEVIKSKFVEKMNKIKIEVLQNSDSEIDSVNPRHLFNMINDWIRKEFEENKLNADQLLLKTYMLYLNNNDNSLHDCLDIENDDNNYSELIHEYKCLSRKFSITKRIENLNNVNTDHKLNDMINTDDSNDKNNVLILKTNKIYESTNETSKSEVDETNHNFTYNFIKSNNKNILPSKPKQFLFTRSDSDSSLSSIADDDENDWKILAIETTSKNNLNGLSMIAGKLCFINVNLKLNSSHTKRSSSFEKTEICSTIAPMNNVRCALGCACLDDKLVVCGGYDRSECLNTVEIFNALKNKWEYLEPMNVARARFNVTVLENKIYAIGGSDGQKELNSAEVYDPTCHKWKFITKCPIERSNAGVCSFGGEIYLIGGWDGKKGLKRCDVYDPKTNTWRRIGDLQIGRYQVSVAVLNDKIYAIGGCGTWTCLNSVERYDFQKNEWQLITSMHETRRGCGVDTIENKIYVVGGHNGVNSLCSCEIYDPKENSWSKGPSLTTCRANVAVCVVKNTLYSVGGFSGKNFLNTVEYLDSKNNEWTTFVRKNFDVENYVNETIDEELKKNSKSLLSQDTDKHKLKNDEVNETKENLNDKHFENNYTNGKEHKMSKHINGKLSLTKSKSKEPLVEVEGETMEEVN